MSGLQKPSPAEGGSKLGLGQKMAGTTILLLFTSLPLNAFFVDSGETGFEFLKIPMAARANALGASFTAMHGDVASLEYNPAGLIGLERLDVGVSHQSYFEDAALNAVSVGYPFYIPFLGRRRASSNGNDLGNVTVGFQYKEFHANDDRRDPTGIPIGELSVRDQIIQTALAYDAGAFAIGASWKYIRNKLDQEERKNSAFDIGALLKTRGPLSLGASVLNIGPSKQFVEEKEPLPTLLRMGAAYQWQRWNFLADVAQTRDKQTQPSIGAEYALNRLLVLRAGARYHTSFEPSGGLGFRFAEIGSAPVSSTSKQRTLGRANSSMSRNRDDDNRSIGFGLDYALRSHETLGVVHTLTLKILY